MLILTSFYGAICRCRISITPDLSTYVLTAHVIKVEEDGLSLRLPHPLAFALHKLFVSSRRKDKGKAIRDKEMALRILTAAQISGKIDGINSIWTSFTKKEKRVILDVIKKENKATIGGGASEVMKEIIAKRMRLGQ